jgi:uncharacterized membrane protein required for colicin V production
LYFCLRDFSRTSRVSILLIATSALLLQLFGAAVDTTPVLAQEHGGGGVNSIAASSSLRLAITAQEPGDTQLSPALEFVRQMSALDVLFILLWIGIVIYGVSSGVIRQLTLIASLLVGALLAGLAAGPTSVWTAVLISSTRNVALPTTYAILLIFFVVAFYVAIIRVYPETRLGKYYVIDKAGGGVLGFLSGLLLISILVGMLAVLTSQPWIQFEDTRANLRLQLTSTPFLPAVAASFPLITQLVASSLPLPIKELCERCL